MSVLKLESQAPVAIHPYRPTIPLRSLQRVQPKPWNVHVLDRLRRIQCRQKHAEPLGVMGLNACRAPRPKEPAESLVPERLDHLRSIPCCASRNKRRNVVMNG